LKLPIPKCVVVKAKEAQAAMNVVQGPQESRRAVAPSALPGAAYRALRTERVHLRRKRFSEADDVRTFPYGTIQVVELGDMVVGKLEYRPGWRWSTDVKPVEGTPWCEHHHVLLTVSGRFRTAMSDGAELEMGPGDIVEVPPGHDAWVIGDETWVAYDLAGMRTYGRSKNERPDRILASIVMTDIVDSTRMANELGPIRWRDLVSEHNRLAAEAIERHHGRFVKTTGDGVLAVFDGAERAVRAAAAIRDGVATLGLAVRAGVQTGEIESTSDDVRGLAIHAAARVMALAAANEVLVSATVRDLVDGSDLAFQDAGVHRLKGLAGGRRLFRLV
jgi:class 3 adenylate cyclase/mannose-6-phosphate isomerase-like protein (cupin superfamily)